jgi:hypothetical protein
MVGSVGLMLVFRSGGSGIDPQVTGHPGLKKTLFSKKKNLPGDQKYQLANITNLLHESANFLVIAKSIPLIG